ncbi:MAG: response regulator [Desulfovibrio sp.]|nr:response regulator [Desulfovibrio sp.]
MSSPSEKTLLIVDDEPDVRNFLAACAEDADFKVVTAVDGEDALAKVQSVNPDLMTLDMVMPKKSGLKVLKELRSMQKYAELPVIVITAHAGDELGSEDIKKIYTTFSGGNAPKVTLEKPITPDKLIRAIAEILGVDLGVPAEKTKTSAPPHDIASMLAGADFETLAKVRELLTEQSSKGRGALS